MVSALQTWVKKILFVAVLTAMLGGLSVTAAYADADTSCGARPGCSCDVWKAQKNKADALRVRDKAYASQIIKQNDNSPGMTCYDHALALSSRLGQIFSDTSAGTTFAGANQTVFGTIYDTSSGVGNNPNNSKSKMLGSQYGVVLDKQLQSYASQYTDSLSSALGATALGFLSTFSSGINAIAATFSSYFSQIDSAISSMQGYITMIQQVLDYMGAALPAAIPAFVAMVQGYWNMIKSTVMGAFNAAQSMIASFVNQITSMVMGALGSIFSNNDPATGECQRISRLWDPTAGGSVIPVFAAAMSLTGFRPMTGGGIEHGTPYFDFKSLVDKSAKSLGLGGTFSAALSNPGDYLKHEINNSANSPLLSAALADINSGGVLNTFKAVDGATFWTKPEDLPLTTNGGYSATKADIDNILNKM